MNTTDKPEVPQTCAFCDAVLRSEGEYCSPVCWAKHHGCEHDDCEVTE